MCCPQGCPRLGRVQGTRSLWLGQPVPSLWQRWPSPGILLCLSRFAAPGEREPRSAASATLGRGHAWWGAALGNACGKQPWKGAMLEVVAGWERCPSHHGEAPPHSLNPDQNVSLSPHASWVKTMGITKALCPPVASCRPAPQGADKPLKSDPQPLLGNASHNQFPEMLSLFLSHPSPWDPPQSRLSLPPPAQPSSSQRRTTKRQAFLRNIIIY